MCWPSARTAADPSTSAAAVHQPAARLPSHPPAVNMPIHISLRMYICVSTCLNTCLCPVPGEQCPVPSVFVARHPHYCLWPGGPRVRMAWRVTDAYGLAGRWSYLRTAEAERGPWPLGEHGRVVKAVFRQVLRRVLRHTSERRRPSEDHGRWAGRWKRWSMRAGVCSVDAKPPRTSSPTVLPSGYTCKWGHRHRHRSGHECGQCA